jgi:hypothetical protein
VGEAGELRSWGGAAVLVILATLLGAGSSVPGGLYSQVYPGPGSNVVETGESFESALTEAVLDTQWDAEALTQYVPAYFTATIIYGKRFSGRPPTIKVAYENDASLRSQQGEFEISSTTPTRQYLDEGTRRADGGFELTWEWKVIPLQSGSLSLELEIQPVIQIGTERTDLQKRNKPIPINVDVHPNKKALDDVVNAAKELEITHPHTFTEGEEATVEASLSLEGHEDVVQANIDLARVQGSVPATIRSAGHSQSGDQVISRWSVTPATPGPVDLLFTVMLSARAGEQPLTTEVPLHRSVTADPAPPSLWERLQTPVLWLTPFVALIGGMLGIRAALARRHRDAEHAVESADNDAE